MPVNSQRSRVRVPREAIVLFLDENLYSKVQTKRLSSTTIGEKTTCRWTDGKEYQCRVIFLHDSPTEINRELQKLTGTHRDTLPDLEPVSPENASDSEGFSSEDDTPLRSLTTASSDSSGTKRKRATTTSKTSAKKKSKKGKDACFPGNDAPMTSNDAPMTSN